MPTEQLTDPQAHTQPNIRKRILWFTNTPMPEVYEHNGISGERHGGPWMNALLKGVRAHKSLDICVITLSETLPSGEFNVGNVTFRTIKINRRLHTWNADKRGLPQLLTAASDYSPDVIHFHGSELQYIELLKNHAIASRSLVSLQGIWTLYAPKVNGSLTFSNLLRATSIAEFVRGKGQLFNRRYANIRSRIERESLAFCKHFLGRTDWDKTFVAFYAAKTAKYHHSGEILRKEFYDVSWSRSVSSGYNYIFTNVSGPIKGVEDILVATALLVKSGYPVQLKLAGYVGPGSAYGKHLLQIIASYALEQNVVFLGYLSASQLADEMVRATAFISASYSDNSPNSIAEAQIVGLPVIASGVGGVTSIVENGRTGLIFAVGEPHMLAAKMLQLGEDVGLSMDLSRAAKATAISRHDPQTVVSSVLKVYEEICQGQL